MPEYVRTVIRARLRRRHADGERGRTEEEVVEIEPGELTGVFSTPRWLRDMGLTAWLLVGVTLLLVGAVWLLSLTHTIVLPVITAAVIAAVASPVLRWLAGRGLPRGVGAALLLLALVVLGAGVVFVIVAGITSQSADLSAELSDAKDTIEGWLEDLGVDPSKAQDAKNDAG